MDLPNTRLWRDTSCPMASSPRTALLSHLKKITGARSKSALTENAPYKACSGFTHVTAHRIAQSPKATFVTRLQPCRLPSRAARQLPDQSTILRVESSSTDDSRLRGARPISDMVGSKTFVYSDQHARLLRPWRIGLRSHAIEQLSQLSRLSASGPATVAYSDIQLHRRCR